MTVTLRQNGFELILAPELGGSIMAFSHEGTDLLRPARPRTGKDWDGRDMSAFPLVPFCGRITNGVFTINQLTLSLSHNMPPEPHAIHGFSWQSNWTCEALSPTEAILTYHHETSAWPWAFVARQHFTLLEDGLHLNLSLNNLSNMPMPAGLGWHPYFPRAGASITADTRGVWHASGAAVTDLEIPCPAALDLRQGRKVRDLTIDHAFNIGDRQHVMAWADRTLTLLSDATFSHLVVYAPPGEDYFCVEPVSHTPNAVNIDRPNEETGLRLLMPGQNLNGTVRLVLSNTR